MTDILAKPHLLTLRQVSVIIMVHERTVRRFIEEGKLSGHNPNGKLKGLRITTDSVKKYLQQFLLEEFNEEAFNEQLARTTSVQHTVKRPLQRSSGWVRNY